VQVQEGRNKLIIFVQSCTFSFLAVRGERRIFAKVDVDGAQFGVGWIGEEAVWHGIHELVDDFCRWMRIIVTLRVQLYIGSEAEGVQFSAIVQHAVGEEVVAAHVLGDIVPVMLAHGEEAFSGSPFGLLDVRFVQRNLHSVGESIGSNLEPQSGTRTSFFEFLFRASSTANQAWIDEVGRQRPVIAVVGVVRVLRRNWRREFRFQDGVLDSSDIPVFVKQQIQCRVFVLFGPVSLSEQFTTRSCAEVVTQFEVFIVLQIYWHLGEGKAAEYVGIPGDSELRPIGVESEGLRGETQKDDDGDFHFSFLERFPSDCSGCSELLMQQSSVDSFYSQFSGMISGLANVMKTSLTKVGK